MWRFCGVSLPVPDPCSHFLFTSAFVLCCAGLQCAFFKKKIFFFIFLLSFRKSVMIGKEKRKKERKPIYEKESYLYNSEWMLKEFPSQYIL